MNYAITYLVSLITLCLLDYLWLGVVMKDTINHWLWWLMKDQMSRWPAVAFYVLYTIAIMIFAIIPAVREHTIYHALWYGAFLWFTAYMTYDMTNRATLKDRPVAMVFPDIARWAVVTAIVAVVWYLVMTKLA